MAKKRKQASRWRLPYPRTVLAFTVGLGVLVAIALIFGEPQHRSTIAADGQPAIVVSCWVLAHCKEESQRVCPGGYDKLSSSSRSWTVNVFHESKYKLFYEAQEEERYDIHWVIRCK